MIPGVFGSSPLRGRGDSATATVSVTGIDTLLRIMAGLSSTYEARMGQGMMQWMQGVIKEAKDQHVPIDTAALRDSGFARGPIREPGAVVVEGGFGPSKDERNRRGGQPPSQREYALVVHEENIPHQHGTWKYLQIPFIAREPQLAGIIRTAMGF